ncbi:MAG: hypothetical protein I4N51_05610 [Acinetobacter sp.]|nr:hypothetical protein [Acinetobacter sp.]
MNFKSPYKLAILAIVLYSTSMLVYGTLRIFIGENIDAISAFGSVLGGLGAFYAAFMAFHIYKGWKVQANFELKKEHVNHLSTLLSMGYDETHKISEILLNLAKIGTHEVLAEKYFNFSANDLRSEFYKTQINAKMLDRLNEKEKDIFIYFAKYQTHFMHLVESFNNIQNKYKTYYQNKMDSMDDTEKLFFESDGFFWINPSPNPNDLEKMRLKNLILHRIKFQANNHNYNYNNPEEMIKEMSNIYKILEKKILDSIDLKIN